MILLYLKHMFSDNENIKTGIVPALYDAYAYRIVWRDGVSDSFAVRIFGLDESTKDRVKRTGIILKSDRGYDRAIRIDTPDMKSIAAVFSYNKNPDMPDIRKIYITDSENGKAEINVW